MRKAALIATMVLAAFGGSACPAQNAVRSAPYAWNNVKVGAGGFAPNIVFSRAERGLAYLRTDMGGAYRWDDKAGRWMPLQDGNAESSYMGIESIAPDPVDPDIVYIAAGMGKRGPASIQRSADRGRTWRIVEVPFKMGGNEDGRGLGERLAVDPHRNTILMFGSRHDGLQRSDDAGASWTRVASFPHAGRGLPGNWRQTNAGTSFVLFDPSSGRRGQGSRTIYAAVADPGERHLFRSNDGGRSWTALPGGPPAALLPVKGAIDRQGRLYIAYGTGMGPNGIARGAVWRFDGRSGSWTDITPDRAPGAEGGYMGLSLDARRPGRLVVSSVNRWRPGDTVWLSEDAGATWRDLGKNSLRDVSETPFLKLAGDEADFGHWTAGLALDPFDGNHIAYTTGATVYATRDLRRWKPWVKGIEQTAVITFTSPTGGAHLSSGFGDIAGFVHDRLDVSPPRIHLNPHLNNTNNLDYAGLKPNVVVRSGSSHNPDPQVAASLGWSEDGGRSWQPLRTPAQGIEGAEPKRFDLNGEVAITASADGRTLMVATPQPLLTRDRGQSWKAATGLPLHTRPVADKADPTLFYAVDFAGGRLFLSRDGGSSFAPLEARGLPASLAAAKPRNREGQFPLVARPGKAGELWFLVGGALYRSGDAGARFERASGESIAIELFGLGKAAEGKDLPTLYAIGTSGGIRGIWRSDDGGAGWLRINDNAHQWGLRFRAVGGDPRLWGRVYVATDGRGIFYADPVAARPR